MLFTELVLMALGITLLTTPLLARVYHFRWSTILTVNAAVQEPSFHV